MKLEGKRHQRTLSGVCLGRNNHDCNIMDFNIHNRKQKNSHQSLQTRAFRTLFEVSVFLLRASLFVRFCCAFCRLCQIVDVRAFRCIVLAATRRLAAATAIATITRACMAVPKFARVSVPKLVKNCLFPFWPSPSVSDSIRNLCFYK